jgi:outer membrane protein assembly factor BamB
MGGQLLAIDLGSGSLTWTAINEDAWSSSPAISRTGVYVGDADGRLHRLDKDDGGEIWTLDLISPITGAPAIARGFIYVGLANGDVVALGRKP